MNFLYTIEIELPQRFDIYTRANNDDVSDANLVWNMFLIQNGLVQLNGLTQNLRISDLNGGARRVTVEATTQLASRILGLGQMARFGWNYRFRPFVRLIRNRPCS